MEEALQGSISRFKLPEIFQLISQSRKTGTLGIQKDDDIVMVYFKKGRITYAYGPRQTRHLGEILREKGRLTTAQLSRAVEIQSTQSLSKRLGQIMMEEGYIDRADLSEVVREQIEELMYSLLTWEAGAFKFYENQYPTREEITVDFSVENVILEGVRRIDETNRLKEIFPDPDSTLKIQADNAGPRRDINLEPEEWNLLAQVDGRKTVKELIETSGLNRSVALEKLATLKLAGLVVPSPKTDDPTGHLEEMVDRLAGLLEEYLEVRARQIPGEVTTTQVIGEKS